MTYRLHDHLVCGDWPTDETMIINSSILINALLIGSQLVELGGGKKPRR